MATAQIHKPPVLNELHPVFTTLHEAKATKKLTFEKLAETIGRSEWYTAAIFYGQAKPTSEDLEKLAKALDIPFEILDAGLGEGFFPHRGLGDLPPKDPTIYRLYEAIVVYGNPIKQLIHEKFGDGIMSLIAFEGTVGKTKVDGDDWVDLHLKGKFLPYRRW